MVGSSIMLTVREPARMLLEPPNSLTKVIMPNSPYTMDGTPLRISMAERMSRMSGLSRRAYSFRNTAVMMPTGTAMSRLRPTAYSVVMMAGR